MRDQEIGHLRTCESLLSKYRARPTLLLPLWHVAGWGLGAGSALLGERAAMACTEAVEQVIVSHYNDQLRTLSASPFRDREDVTQLRAIIRQHRDDEEEHQHTAVEYEAHEAPFYKLLTQSIQAGCHMAIAVAKRI